MLNEYKSLFKNKNFILLWISQLFSQLTIHIVNFTLLLKLFSITGSTIATSLLWVTYALPAILVGPIAAVVVDVVDRKKMLMITNFFQAVVILLYSFYHEPYFFLLYGVVIAYSFLNQFYVPSELSSLPSLVKKHDLPNANGLFFLSQQGAMIVGFSIAGFLISYFSFSNTLVLSSLLLFVAFVSVSFLPKMTPQKKLPKRFEEMFIIFFKEIFEGYRFLRRRKDILLPFSLLIGFQIGLIVVMVNVPAIASDILKIKVESAGIGIVVPAGIGAAIGALTVPRILKSGKRKKGTIESCLMLLGFIILSLTFIVPQLDGLIKTTISSILIIVAGVSFVGILIPAQTYLQEATPGGLRGRVFGNFWFIVTVVTVLPVIFSGTVTELFGIRLLFLILGSFILAGLIFSKRFGQKVLENGIRTINE